VAKTVDEKLGVEGLGLEGLANMMCGLGAGI